MSFRACAEANDTELALTTAHQGTDNAVFVAAGGSVGTGIGCCWNGSLWTFFRDPVGSALYGPRPVVIQVGKPYKASGQDERKPGTPGTFWKEGTQNWCLRGVYENAGTAQSELLLPRAGRSAEVRPRCFFARRELQTMDEISARPRA